MKVRARVRLEGGGEGGCEGNGGCELTLRADVDEDDDYAHFNPNLDDEGLCEAKPLGECVSGVHREIILP